MSQQLPQRQDRRIRTLARDGMSATGCRLRQLRAGRGRNRGEHAGRGRNGRGWGRRGAGSSGGEIEAKGYLKNGGPGQSTSRPWRAGALLACTPRPGASVPRWRRRWEQLPPPRSGRGRWGRAGRRRWRWRRSRCGSRREESAGGEWIIGSKKPLRRGCEVLGRTVVTWTPLESSSIRRLEVRLLSAAFEAL